MSEDPRAAEHRQHFGLPGVVDPRNYDPRKVLDATALDHMMKAQAAARAEAAASTTVFIGTVVTLITSAFGLVAALAWNTAITLWIQDLTTGPLAPLHLNRHSRGGGPGDHRHRHRGSGGGNRQSHCWAIRQAKCLQFRHRVIGI